MERVLAQLAGFEEEGAPALTTRALEAVDLVNNALDMQAEVRLHFRDRVLTVQDHAASGRVSLQG